MEPSGRNRWQPLANWTTRKRLKQADPHPVATHGNVQETGFLVQLACSWNRGSIRE
jgi:hypothetical protein